MERYNAVKLIDDARLIWRRWSVWLLGSQATVIATWVALDTAGLAPTLPEWVKGAVALTFIAASVGAMHIKQKKLSGE